MSVCQVWSELLERYVIHVISEVVECCGKEVFPLAFAFPGVVRFSVKVFVRYVLNRLGCAPLGGCALVSISHSCSFVGQELPQGLTLDGLEKIKSRLQYPDAFAVVKVYEERCQNSVIKAFPFDVIFCGVASSPTPCRSRGNQTGRDEV